MIVSPPGLSFSLMVQLRREKTFPKQLAAADQLVQEGDLRTASLIFQRMALSRPPTGYSEAARNQLRKLQDSARQERKTIDEQLSVSELGSDTNPDQIAGLFQQYDDLVQKYSGVPVVNQELAKYISKQRRDPKYTVILSEAEARRLWTLGEEYEQDSSLCCAHEVYGEASLFVPAETASRATVRIREIDRDPTLASKIVECRKLQTSHDKFQVAETLRETFPSEAEAQYRWILKNAPHDSRVFIASNDRLKKMTVEP